MRKRPRAIRPVLSRRLRKRPRAIGPFLLSALLGPCIGSCAADPELQPDEVLRAELGLTDRDEVYRVTISGGEREGAEPVETILRAGAYVEFVTADWLVHEVAFELDSLSADARDFLERTDQVASPPLLRMDSRYVVNFAGSPPGRYPYLLAGNAAPGRGVVVVEIRP